MFSKEEKILILGSLFHDIGKFAQRIFGVSKTHEKEGNDFFDDEYGIKDSVLKILGGEENYSIFLDIINDHHQKGSEGLISIVQQADYLAASERPEFERWGNKMLSSVFSKLQLLNIQEVNPKYYKQQLFTRDNWQFLIPELTKQEEQYKYKIATYDAFRKDISSLLSFYDTEEDFPTVTNLLATVFEKYLWCVPDFTGSPETDISLYNHLKDVCGISLAMFKSDSTGNLNLVVGDIPGIQKYIFDISEKHAAKILRGRSISLQILSRQFASIFIDVLGLTVCNLVMDAAGKFYIIAQHSIDFDEKYKEAKSRIEDFLFENYGGEMKFNAAYAPFKVEELRDKVISFGEVVEKVNIKLGNNKQRLFSEKLETKGHVIGSGKNIAGECRVTSKVVLDGNNDFINEDLVTKQVKAEYNIGDNITDNNVFVEFDAQDTSINYKVYLLSGSTGLKPENFKVLINCDIDSLLDEIRKTKDHKLNFLRNCHFLQVANYTKKDYKQNVASFTDIAESKEQGAGYLALVRGDIDNLGMLMAIGLERDGTNQKKETYSAISRITTLSNHLKYFFSYYLNGFLQNKFPDSYTIYAGGDDLMLVCHQSEAVELVNMVNEKFNEFVCGNPEIHISYSITHFKDHTPIRIVADLAEENQEKAKETKGSETELNFTADNNKAKTRIFNTNIKNADLGLLIHTTNELAGWLNSNKISSGAVYYLLQSAEILKKFKKDGDSRRLLYHPMLTYYVRRNIKDKTDSKVEQFFETVLSIAKNTEEQKLENILYPAVCGTIFKTRS